MVELYTTYCSECRKATIHYITKISRKRGVKLKCTGCHKQKSRYAKLSNLIKYEFKEIPNAL